MAAEQNNDAERREFETWATERWTYTEINMRNRDTYLVVSLNAAWRAWQECNRRSAAIGEGGLPEPLKFGIGLTHDYVAGYNQAIADVKARNPHKPGEGSQQAAQGVKTWQERAQELGFSGRPQGYPDTEELEALKQAEIADLRAQLARQSQEPFAWEATTSCYTKYITDSRYQKLRPSFQKWYRPICQKCAAPPLSSEQQAAKCVGCEGKPSAENNPCAVCGKAVKEQPNVG
jgi:hypothetical protein